MARIGRSRLRALPAVALLAIAFAGGCGGHHEPVTGVFGYPWGTPMDKVLADSVDIAVRLSEPGFALMRQPGQLYLLHVQYGMGYGDLRLDFDSTGALWHGMIRVEAGGAAADSIRNAWREKYGRESDEGRVDTDSGSAMIWSSGSTVDRHFFAPRVPTLDPSQVRALEIFHGGCIAGCPLYSVRLFPDGRALFLGIREIDPLGGYTGTWPKERWNELAARAVSVDVRSLEPEFSPTTEGGDARRGLATVLWNGDRSTYTSVKESAPKALESLLASLDSVAAAVVWERPVFTWDTLDVRAVSWLDLDSLEQLSTPH